MIDLFIFSYFLFYFVHLDELSVFVREGRESELKWGELIEGRTFINIVILNFFNILCISFYVTFLVFFFLCNIHSMQLF